MITSLKNIVRRSPHKITQTVPEGTSMVMSMSMVMMMMIRKRCIVTRDRDESIINDGSSREQLYKEDTSKVTRDHTNTSNCLENCLLR